MKQRDQDPYNCEECRQETRNRLNVERALMFGEAAPPIPTNNLSITNPDAFLDRLIELKNNAVREEPTDLTVGNILSSARISQMQQMMEDLKARRKQ